MRKFAYPLFGLISVSLVTLAAPPLTGNAICSDAHAGLFHTPPLTGLVISETDINWGTIASTQPVTRTVTIKNESTGNITIDSVRVSCGCLTVELEKRNIAPGESTSIKAKFDPTGYAGNVYRTVDLGFRNDSGEESVVTINGRAFVQDPIQLSVRQIVFEDIDINADNKQGYYISDPVALTPTITNSGSWSPVASIPENLSQAFVAAIDKRDDSYILETYFFPKQLLAASQDRSGEFNLKIYTDTTQSQFVNLPIHWRIKSNFSVTPERPLFIDGEPQDDEYLSITSVNGQPFEISGITFLGSTLGKDKIESEPGNVGYRLKLSELGALIDHQNSSGRAQSDLVINTNVKDEPIVKVPVATLFTKRGE